MHSQDRYFKDDASFLTLLPENIQPFNNDHFTPIEVVKKAAQFLGSDVNARILDIGSGVGKFCLTAAQMFPQCTFYGIEQRMELHDIAEEIKQKLLLNNVYFIHGNIDQIKFSDYQHLYFFNSFHEQLDEAEKMDGQVSHSEMLYHYYNRYFFRQLENMPSGTKLVCFFTLEEEIPSSYLLAEHYFGGKLTCYVKI